MCDDLLRRAAAHIRYLAGPPVEWDADSPDWETWEIREQDHRGWWSRLIGRTRRPTRALHVAAWDPKVAHHVAAMLDCASRLKEPHERESVASDQCGWCGYSHLDTIAQALLGEGSDGRH